jgi:hypothetical protein
MAAVALAGTVLIAACGDGQSRARDGKGATGAIAAAIQACSGKSKAQRGTAADPKTWARSDYDSCMAGEANKTRPANREICGEAHGVIVAQENASPGTAQCILEIL